MTDSLINDLVQRIGILEERGKAQELLIKDLQGKVNELQKEKDSSPENNNQCDKDEKSKSDDMSGKNAKNETRNSTWKVVQHSHTRKNSPGCNLTVEFPSEFLSAIGGGCSSGTCSSGNGGRVAFHATIDTNTGWPYAVSHLTIGQVIVFDQEKLNIGGGYHKSTGLFVAQLQGVYMFSASVMTKGEIHLNIVKNDEPIASLYASEQQQGSVSMVTELQVGDEVFVRVQRPDDNYIWGDRLTSFSGCLIA